METPLEAVLMNSYKEGMLQFIEDNPVAFNELVQLSFTDNQPYAWRATWLLGTVMEDNDSRLLKYIQPMIEFISICKKDGQQRDLLRILSRMNLDDEMEGLYFDTCVSLWEQIGKIPSVRYTALKGIVEIAKKYPEMVDEVKLLTQDHYLDELSPGVKHSAKRMMKELEKAVG